MLKSKDWEVIQMLYTLCPSLPACIQQLLMI